jgi:hypothetical protein
MKLKPVERAVRAESYAEGNVKIKKIAPAFIRWRKNRNIVIRKAEIMPHR